MRILGFSAALTFLLASSAAAQMCGGSMQQNQASPSGGMAGMSCMGQAQPTEATDIFGRPQAKSSGMMCACCRNMASMGGMKHDEQKLDEHRQEPAPAPKQN